MRILFPILALLAACASAPKDDAKVVVAGLDEPAYATLVHPVFERDCGSADCHGKLPRGLRIYGATALRLSGATGPTTDDEKHASYLSILGLEPERLDDFLGEKPRTADEARKLLVLAKPLTLERHRPGVSLRKGEPAEQCILSWLLGAADPIACRSQ